MAEAQTLDFSLERHAGEYHTWPLRSRLIQGGGMTSTLISGYSLLHAERVTCAGSHIGYLLVTDHDCPFEETTVVTLLNSELRVVSERFVLHDLFDRFEWTGEREFLLRFVGGAQCAGGIRRRSIPYLYPRLRLKRLSRAEATIAAPSTEDRP